MSRFMVHCVHMFLFAVSASWFHVSVFFYISIVNGLVA